MKFLLVVVALSLFFCAGSGAAQNKPDVSGMERKLSHIESNASAAHPDSTPAVFTEDEVNAYIAAGRLDLPAGVRSLRFQSEPSVVTAAMQVDFDKLQEGRSSMNPLLSVFSGVHDVVVAAHAHGTGGFGYVQVDSVTLDGVEIPRFALQLFLEKFLQPKYPGVGVDSKFTLPDRIDTATVGLHTLTVVQK